jgi:hypothetical protein
MMDRTADVRAGWIEPLEAWLGDARDVLPEEAFQFGSCLTVPGDGWEDVARRRSSGGAMRRHRKSRCQRHAGALPDLIAEHARYAGFL